MGHFALMTQSTLSLLQSRHRAFAEGIAKSPPELSLSLLQKLCQDLNLELEVAQRLLLSKTFQALVHAIQEKNKTP